MSPAFLTYAESDQHGFFNVSRKKVNKMRNVAAGFVLMLIMGCGAGSSSEVIMPTEATPLPPEDTQMGAPGSTDQASPPPLPARK